MKTYLNLFVLIAICLTTLFCTGMDGCNTEEEPAVFVSATPPDGSTLQKDATIVAVFDAPPSGIDMSVPDGVTFSPSGTTVTITGGFTPGPLTLVLTWAGGATTLTYTVESDAPTEPDGPSPEEQLAGVYNLIQLDYDKNWTDAADHIHPWPLRPPIEPPIVTGTLTMFAGDSFSMKYETAPRERGGHGGGTITTFEADKWDASPTNIFLDIDSRNPDISYTWQGTTRTTLIMKVRLPRNWGLLDPEEQILVWKRTE